MPVKADQSTPERALDWIGEYCLALAHRWDPERLVVVFTAYFDETDTHGPSPTVIVAGFLGHAFQWRRFGQKLAKLQAREGFSIFHAKEFKARTGEFAGWPEAKRARLIAKLTELVRTTLTEGMAVSLSRERYLSEYRAPPIPRKMNLDSQYGACFRACMARLFDVMAARNYRDTLHVVMERGHKNAGDCERIFNDLREHCKVLAGSDFLGDFTLRPKDGCPPLMVADMLAATYSMYRTQTAAGTLDPTPYMPPRQDKGKLVWLELRPDALRDLKVGFETMRELKIKDWRERRARKTSSSESPP